MGLPSDVELLALAISLAAVYLLVSIGYRRFLFRWLPDPDEISPEADEPTNPGELHCPHCGAINDVDFDKCHECARQLPPEPIDHDTDA